MVIESCIRTGLEWKYSARLIRVNMNSLCPQIVFYCMPSKIYLAPVDNRRLKPSRTELELEYLDTQHKKHHHQI